ncbi:MAG: hypothetical protein EON98_01045, partial [Chitinophagaceae bacterium]
MFSGEAWEYEFRYEVIDTLSGPNDIEPNNNFVQAQPVAAGDTTSGRIGYKVNGVNDDNDYFRAVLPSDGKVRIYVQAINRGQSQQATFDWLSLSVYDGKKSLLLRKHVANNDDVLIGQTVYDTINICGVAKDTIYFHINSPQKFQYSVRYELIDTVTNYGEPDNSFAQARRIKGAQTYQSTLNYTARGVNDGLDYYQVPFGNNDVLKLQMSGVNQGCSNGNITVRVYNKNRSQIQSKLFGNNNNVGIGQTIADSISIPVTAVDTLYLRFESSDPFTYQFTTGPLLPYSPFAVA